MLPLPAPQVEAHGSALLTRYEALLPPDELRAVAGSGDAATRRLRLLSRVLSRTVLAGCLPGGEKGKAVAPQVGRLRGTHVVAVTARVASRGGAAGAA